jgi:hypothetical protein
MISAEAMAADIDRMTNERNPSRLLTGREETDRFEGIKSDKIEFMSDLAYFEYSLVLPEERYLIEVQTRNPASGELRGQEETEGIAKECLALVIGEGHDDVVKGIKPNPISELEAQRLTKVQQVLTRPDTAVYLIE